MSNLMILPLSKPWFKKQWVGETRPRCQLSRKMTKWEGWTLKNFDLARVNLVKTRLAKRELDKIQLTQPCLCWNTVKYMENWFYLYVYSDWLSTWLKTGQVLIAAWREPCFIRMLSRHVDMQRNAHGNPNVQKIYNLKSKSLINNKPGLNSYSYLNVMFGDRILWEKDFPRLAIENPQRFGWIQILNCENFQIRPSPKGFEDPH